MSDVIEPIPYKVMLTPESKKEWDNTDHSIQIQLKKKLQKVRYHPIVPKNKLSGMNDCYKIKLKRAGYRLVYQVVDDTIQLIVWAVDKREDSKVYNSALKRLSSIVDSELSEMELDS